MRAHRVVSTRHARSLLCRGDSLFRGAELIARGHVLGVVTSVGSPGRPPSRRPLGSFIYRLEPRIQKLIKLMMSIRSSTRRRSS